MLSVRARTALGATAVVAVALVLAGVAVVAALRAGLVDTTRAQAVAKAREVAAQVAVEPSADDARGLDTDDPVQVVDGTGRVLASSDELEGAPAITTANRPDPQQSSEDDDPEESDDDSGRGRGRGRSGGDDRGSVDSEVVYTEVQLPVDDDGQATSDRDDANGTSRFTVAAVQASTPDREPVTVYAGASLATQQQAVDDVTRSMLLGLPLMLLVVGLVTWLTTRRALRPVEAIRAEMAEITASHDLTRRVPVPRTRDEVARLASTTNDTLAALEHAMERQRRFVADASHELRSPIASVRTQLEVGLAHPELLDVAEAVQDVVRLQNLAADLLLLARLDAGDRTERELVDLGSVVREEVARHSGGTLTPTVRGEGARVRGSRRQLERVVSNLLDNARRHARSSIEAEVRTEGATAVVSVTDDGAGVPESDRDRIFERFVRLDSARARDDGGAGLGLAIVRDVARRHGGEVTVSTAAGGGAVFELRLPLA